jgi:molybdenum cofactor cytidylyltransferase
MSIAAIVLAAGRSSRMGSRNKLLEPIDGKPIIARVAQIAIESGVVCPVIVVTGFEAGRVSEALQGLDVTIVNNPDFEQGMSTSLRAGLRALPLDCDGAVILLGDMPQIEASDIAALVAAAEARNAICVPIRDGKQGNPVLWGAAYFAEMMLLTGDKGAKQLLAKHRDKIIEVPIASDRIFADIDTEDDLARFRSVMPAKAGIQ